MKSHILILLCCLCTFSIKIHAQYQKYPTWSSSRLYDDWKLQGPVKTWAIKNEEGLIRKQHYDKLGNLVKDSCLFSPFQSSPPDEEVQQLKANLEKIVSHREKHEDTNTWIFNERGQLLALKSPNQNATSTFTADGKILSYKSIQITTQTRAWNSIHHDEPTYTFTDTTYCLAVFKYNQAGLLKEFEYFHSNYELNLRWVYRYDSTNHRIEINRYDYLNVGTHYVSNDAYPGCLMAANVDSTFNINNFFDGFWEHGYAPYAEHFKYNAFGKKTETTTYGGWRHELGSKTTWEYDSLGNVTQEIHHDVYHNVVQSILKFDNHGNVIHETHYNLLGEITYQFYFEIKYY